MDDSPVEPITELLKDAYSGNENALNDVMSAVYDELRGRARNLMLKERPGHTLQPTELVHNAFMRLMNQRCDWQNRNHFFSIASAVMRRVLLDHARDRRALKRGGDRQREVLDPERVVASGWGEHDFLALAEAVEPLEKKDPELAKLVDMSLFGGMRYEDIASETGASVDDVEKDLKVATMMILRDQKRDEEIAAWRAWTRARDEVHRSFDTAREFYEKAQAAALENSPEELAARQGLEKLYLERLRESRGLNQISLRPEFFKSLIDSLGLGTYDEELAGAREVTIRSHPTGADVYCFRYRESETRLVPLPYWPTAGLEDTAKGFLGEPFLEIERTSKEHAFQPGDRLVSVQGTRVSTRTDLVRELRSVQPAQRISVTVERNGDATAVEWTPFGDGLSYQESEQPGRVSLFWQQLGIAFQGYPLDVLPECHLGVTNDTGLQVLLNPGSYLLLLRKHGHDDARLCLHIPEHGGEHSVTLHETGYSPKGFLCVPAGPAEIGADVKAFQSKKRESKQIPEYFMSRLEVTTSEYLDYLNSPQVLPAISHEVDKQDQPERSWGTKPPAFSDEVRQTVSSLRVVPEHPGWFWDDSAQRFSTNWRADRPVSRISQLAAREYAAWRTSQSDTWELRLPDDDQWKKAARGADRRTYVWGNYLVANFCWSYNAFQNPNTSRLVTVNAFPTDESVYGIRDLAGSLREFTSSKTLDRYNYISQRGGNFRNTDEYEFRVATRNGLRQGRTDIRVGIRLIAVPKTETSK